MKFSHKILIILLVTSMVPILIASYIYNKEVNQSIDEKVNVFFRQIVEQNASFIEYEIRDIEKVTNFIIGNEMVQDTLVDFDRKTTTEKISAWLDISDIIQGTLLQSSNIQSVAFIFNDHKEYILFGDNTSDESRAFHRFFRHEFDALNIPANNNIHWEYKFIENNNKLLVSRKLTHFNTGKNIGTVALIVDIGNLSNIILDANTGEGERIYMLDNNGHELGTNNISNSASRKRVKVIYDELVQINRIYEAPIAERSGIKYFSEDEAMIYVLLNNGYVLVSEVDINLLTQDIEEGRRTIYAVILIGIIAVLIIAFVFSRYVSSKFSQLVDNMTLLQNGNFNINKPRKSIGDEFVYINMFFYNMAKELKTLIEMSYVQEIEKKEAKLQALQNQINPHFLYNTLEIIRSMSILGETEEIGEITMRLGNLFRYNLSKKNIELVLIEQELEHIKNYVYLMNIHYNNSIILFVECEEELKKVEIPRFILQPIVENSILHGFKHRNGQGVVEVEVKEEGDIINIIITDDGIGMDRKTIEDVNNKISMDSDQGGSIGLKNINQRIKLAYGKKFGVKVEGEIGNLRVSVTIPYKI